MLTVLFLLTIFTVQAQNKKAPAHWQFCAWDAHSSTTAGQFCALDNLGQLPRGMARTTKNLMLRLRHLGWSRADLTTNYRRANGCPDESATPTCDSLSQENEQFRKDGVRRQNELQQLQQKNTELKESLRVCDSLRTVTIKEDSVTQPLINTGIELPKVSIWEFSGSVTGLSWTGANEATTGTGSVRIMRHITPNQFLLGVEAGTVSPLLVENPQGNPINIGAAFAVAEYRTQNSRFEVGAGAFNRPQEGGVTAQNWAVKIAGNYQVAPNVAFTGNATFLNNTYWEANVSLPVTAYEKGKTSLHIGPRATAKEWLPLKVDGYEKPMLMLGAEMGFTAGDLTLVGSVVTDPAGWSANGTTAVVGQVGAKYALTTYKAKASATAKNVKTKKAERRIWYY